MTNWSRRMQCLVAMATYIIGEAKRACPKRSGGNPACPMVCRGLLDSVTYPIRPTFILGEWKSKVV